ncbi:hypothetical protein FHS03_005302 [Massilia violacea]|uniref:Uncharacterized protein n=1 Tax=Pseudoduganella violacea TaxID=1715466 RepID=A0A7W5BHB5_9BURK|nr:hypothetical protein [Pseudoduganella violacea]
MFERNTGATDCYFLNLRHTPHLYFFHPMPHLILTLSAELG